MQANRARVPTIIGHGALIALNFGYLH